MEYGEYFIEALAREVYEELGVVLDLNKIFFLKSFKIRKKREIKLHFFLCSGWKGEIDNRENQLIKWIFPSNLKNYNLLKSNEKFIRYLTGSIFPSAD